MTVTTASKLASSTTSTQTSTSKSALDMQDFLHLLTVQLANQNPLEPMSDRDFFAQMAQLGQVQGLEKLQESSTMQQAQSLMGKQVTAIRDLTDSPTGSASVVTGVVRQLSIKSGEYYLGIQEDDGGIVEVKMKSLQSVMPTDDVSSSTHLIGKHVGGTGYLSSDANRTPVDAVGEVVGISAVDGRTVLQVKTEKNGIVTVPLTNLSQVTE